MKLVMNELRGMPHPLNHRCGVEVRGGIFIEPLQAVGYVECSGIVEALGGQDNLDHFDKVAIKPRLLMETRTDIRHDNLALRVGWYLSFTQV